jgi:hypothetical protein
MTNGNQTPPDANSAAAEFHEKMAKAAVEGLTYQNALENKNAALIKEGEELMANKALEAVQTISLLQKVREKLTGWIKIKS